MSNDQKAATEVVTVYCFACTETSQFSVARTLPTEQIRCPRFGCFDTARSITRRNTGVVLRPEA